MVLWNRWHCSTPVSGTKQNLTVVLEQTYTYGLGFESREETAMKRFALVTLIAISAVTLTTVVASAEETITGRLVEAGCAAMGGAEPSADHVACMVRCARNGDPIGILTDGGLYKITGDWASTHDGELAEMMAKQVRVRGETSKANGEVLLEISTSELVK